MSRDHRKLNVFQQADSLIIRVYAETASFPTEERFGLCAQVRRSAVSVATNIVEGCARRSTGEYLHFMNVATGSAAETLYLIDLSQRLGFFRSNGHEALLAEYTRVVQGLKKLVNSLDCAR